MKAKSMKSLVSIVLVTLMLMPVFVGTASAEQESGSRYYIDLGEMDPRGEGYYLSFALPAGYDVVEESLPYLETAEIRIVGHEKIIIHTYTPERGWRIEDTGPFGAFIYVWMGCYNETIEAVCPSSSKYTRIDGHDTCYWGGPGECPGGYIITEGYIMEAYIFLEECYIGWEFHPEHILCVGLYPAHSDAYVTIGGQLQREKCEQVGNDLFSSVQISGPPPAEEESTYLCDNKLGVKAVELAEKVEGKGYRQGDTLSKGWNSGSFLDPQEIPYFDCSGLVYWSYNRAWEMITGNRIPHYSTWYEDNNCVNEAPHTVFYLGASGQWKDSVRFEQISTSTEIPTVDDLKTGYLLFLDTDSNELADHVGMYVGNGEVIHSKSGVGVERKPLNEWLDLSVAGGKYRNYFFGFGRVKQTSPLPTQPVTPTPTRYRGGGGGGAPRDSDGDGLLDIDEMLTYKTEPQKADTDGGGVNDGEEVARGTDPLDPTDDIVVTPTPSPMPTPTPPGFEAVLSIVGLLAVAYLVLRRR